MKVTSFWYKEGDGQIFHGKDKILLMTAIRESNINLLKNLIINPLWLSSQGETLTPSMLLVGKVRDDLFRDMPKVLKGTSGLNQLALKRVADFIYILHKSDDMYYERFGYMIGRCIAMHDRWITGDHSIRLKMLHDEREQYFRHEKRQDRITHITAAWDYLEAKYASDAWMQHLIDYLIETLWKYREMYNPDEVSRLHLMAFHPENWYPVGRGQMWDAVHAGQG